MSAPKMKNFNFWNKRPFKKVDNFSMERIFWWIRCVSLSFLLMIGGLMSILINWIKWLMKRMIERQHGITIKKQMGKQRLRSAKMFIVSPISSKRISRFPSIFSEIGLQNQSLHGMECLHKRNGSFWTNLYTLIWWRVVIPETFLRDTDLVDIKNPQSNRIVPINNGVSILISNRAQFSNLQSSPTTPHNNG